MRYECTVRSNDIVRYYVRAFLSYPCKKKKLAFSAISMTTHIYACLHRNSDDDEVSFSAKKYVVIAGALLNKSDSGRASL